MKPFKTIDEQIQILESRGLLINDKESAKRYLLSNNYYNIINGYSKCFQNQGDTYISGATFDEVTQLYLFDSAVKQTLFKGILAAESHLKAIFAYRFAESFPSTPYAYLDIACYDSTKTLDVVTTIHKLSGIINKERNIRHSSICHYLNQYNNVPIWVLVNYLDFGELRYMLINAQPVLQNKVAKDLMDFIKQHIPDANIFPPEIMLAFLTNINEVRNICAHNNRLIGFRCRRDDKHWAPLHNRYNIAPNDERRDLYSVFLSLQCFLSKTEYHMLHNTLRKRMNYFSNHLHSIDINCILEKLGFPDNWNRHASKIDQKD